MTRFSLFPTTRRGRLGLAFGLLLPLAASIHPAHAASAVQPLLVRAAHNNNIARTMVYTSVATQANKTMSLRRVIIRQEDNVNNREHDHEDVTERGRDAKGKLRGIHYTLDVIFINNRVYYRSSTNKNGWQSAVGKSLNDHFTGVNFQHARTFASTYPGTKFTVVPQVGGGAHLHALSRQSGVNSTLDIWISSGSTPYVVREEITGVLSTKSGPVQEGLQNTYSLFNQPLKIKAPTQGA